MRLFVVLLLGFCTIPLGAYLADELAKPVPKPVSFVKEIKPIFREKCVHCHNKKTLPNRVSFENRRQAFGKSKEGLVYIVPGNSKLSVIISALNAPHFHEKAMPMVGARPSKKDIEILRRWIDEGAPWPKGLRGKIKPTIEVKE